MIGWLFKENIFMNTKLSRSHRHTYDAVFQHPVARNLDWKDVRSMLARWRMSPRRPTAI